MIIVTGGAGFIGSNLVRALNQRGIEDIVVIDDLSDGARFVNLADCSIADYLDKDEYLAALEAGRSPVKSPRAVFHQGACSDTMEWDGRYMMRNNYAFSRALLHDCMERAIPFLYASSASVYGAGPRFREQPSDERPLNVYAYSKLLFDQYVRRQLERATAQIVGLRYFNVYGPREQHKQRMASVAWHFHNQVLADGEARLFVGCDGYGDGEQRRDFIYVGDIVAVNLWLLDHPEVSGVFNLGTGRSQSFNDVARAVIDWHGRGSIRYVEFPPALAGRYQSFTEADMTRLRAAGYTAPLRSVEEGVHAYLDELTVADKA